ncbi:MAG: hypothetical protein FJY77_04710 [Candidatus Altiarchaeales archaeon]|nr:hypothetical protein [Candidatus Altiarchaeales archaeon]
MSLRREAKVVVEGTPELPEPVEVGSLESEAGCLVLPCGRSIGRKARERLALFVGLSLLVVAGFSAEAEAGGPAGVKSDVPVVQSAVVQPAFVERFRRIRKNPKKVSNYRRLLTDEEFEFHNQMTVEQIQKFFEKTPYGNRSPLADYKNAGGKTAAAMVYEAAKAFRINPELILAKLQVERQLLSRTAPLRKGDLEWALGVGATDKGRVGRYRGFENQVKGATRTLRRHFDEFDPEDREHSRVRVNYGSAWVDAENAATYSLTRYTPHTVDTRYKKPAGGNYLLMDVSNRCHFFRRGSQRYRG